MFYVGWRYSVRTLEHLKRTYRCKHCGFTEDVIVAGAGVGSARGSILLDKEGVKERAAERASQDAKMNANQTLKLRPCPKCKRRDGTGFIVKSALLSIVTASMFVLLFAHLASTPAARAVFWICAVLIPLFVYFHWMHAKWMMAGARVTPAAKTSAKPRRRAKLVEERRTATVDEEGADGLGRRE